MNFDQFRKSLSQSQPPDEGSILLALWYDAKHMEINPKDSRRNLLILLGRIYFSRPVIALRCFEKAVALKPNDQLANFYAGYFSEDKDKRLSYLRVAAQGSAPDLTKRAQRLIYDLGG